LKKINIIGHGKIGKKYKEIIDNLNYAEYCDINDAEYVIISTPHKNHYDVGIKCLSMGYKTLVEKPMSMDKNEYKELSDLGAVTAFSKRYHGKLNFTNGVTCEYSATTDSEWQTKFILDGKSHNHPKNYPDKLLYDFLNENLEKPTTDVVDLIEYLF